MTRVMVPGDFLSRHDDELEPFRMAARPFGATRVVLMAFQGGPELPAFVPARMAETDGFGARVVRGEILRDPPGRLYELCGRELRPLHRVVQGPRGEILEVHPSRPRTVMHPAGDADIVDAEEVPDAPATPSGAAAARGAGESTATAWRKLFADPGARCIVPLGDFRALLTAHLAHPERLRDSHRLACHIQVYEATVGQSLETLVQAVRTDAGADTDIRPLTDEAVERLGLPTLRRPRSSVLRGRRRPGDVLALDRVFCLRVASDPTAVARRPAPTPPPAADPGAAVTAAAANTRRTSIPERFVLPWEFPLSRDEAVYEMDAESGEGAVRRAVRRLWRRLGQGRGFERWRARVAGKSLDEQLWSVRPPKGSLGLSFIREWARERLDAAGYDSGPMIREWEIYWRRKGV